MGRKKVSEEELAARAKANGYEPGAHLAENSIRDIKDYVDETLEDQDGAFELYKK